MRPATAERIADEAAELLLAGADPRLATLRDQYARADRTVEVTGAGFFVEFDVPADAARVPGEDVDGGTLDRSTDRATQPDHADHTDHADRTVHDGAAGADCRLGGVEVTLRELAHGMGVTLFVRGGRLSWLEGYTYEEPLPDRVTVLGVERVDGGAASAGDDGEDSGASSNDGGGSDGGAAPGDGDAAGDAEPGDDDPDGPRNGN